MMFASRLAARTASRRVGQKRSFIDYLVNYPDTVMEKKRFHQANRDKWTWLRYPSDYYNAYFAAAACAYGVVVCGIGHYRLATGKGKLDD